MALPCWWTSKNDSPSSPRARLVSAGRVTRPFGLMETMLRTQTSVYGPCSTWSNSPCVKLPLDRMANDPLSSAGYAELSAHHGLSEDGRDVGGSVVPRPRIAHRSRHHRARLPRGAGHTLWSSNLRFKPQG